MTTTDSVAGIRIVDTDSHVTELPDLWTSRLAKKWSDDAPRVERDANGLARWRIGQQWSTGVAFYNSHRDSAAGVRAVDYDDADPAGFDPKERLRRLDEYGIYAQVLYPNLIAFEAGTFMALDPELSLACVRAYNDFLIEFAEADPARLVPLMMVPMWDVERIPAEMDRAYALGHKGMVFGGHPERAGLPPLWHSHWDPVWAKAQEMQLSVNFHAGFSSFSAQEAKERAERLAGRGFTAAAADVPATFQRYMGAKNASMGQTNNMSTLADLCAGGVCHKFPDLKLVSVESGFGWIPFFLESLDFYWGNMGTDWSLPKPSECFRRQVYATFWFENEPLVMMPAWQDNAMFQTDYPHNAALIPIPNDPERAPVKSVAAHLEQLPFDVRRKVLESNASNLYKL
ncbi:MAG: amidohydrolase family protein [Acidimicrobiia bacterium]